MGKEESTQLVVKNVDFDDFNKYAEQDFINKLSQRGILFLNDKYSSKALIKIKLPKKVTNQLDIADLGKEFRGGSIKEIKNDILYNLFTYKKLGLLGNILTLITDQSYDEYRINTTMAVSRADKKSLKVVISPTPAIIGKKGIKKVLIVFGVLLLVSLAGLTIVFPPAILIFILAAILAVLILPFAFIEGVRKKRIIKKGREQLIDAIQEVIGSDYQTDM
jgi:hypothetical protein